MKFNKDEPGSTRGYSKVFAVFRCSGEVCSRTWNSIHVWNREDDGVYCEVCDRRAELEEMTDKKLELVTYRCDPCDNSWQSIYDDLVRLEPCDICEAMVAPEGPPQLRFGRHYIFRCKNPNCMEMPRWEDFSLEVQKTQRCTKCGNRGDIVKILKGKPFWMRKGRTRKQNKDGGPRADGGDEGPSNHNSSFCDMCQDIISQNIARSCRKGNEVISKLFADESTGSGSLIEKIISIKEVSRTRHRGLGNTLYF